MKFNPGQVVITRGIHDKMQENEVFASHVRYSLGRHIAGDWGEVCDEDRASNEFALQHGERLFSVYRKEGEPTIWIITEWDRSITTVLFPEEY